MKHFYIYNINTKSQDNDELELWLEGVRKEMAESLGMKVLEPEKPKPRIDEPCNCKIETLMTAGCLCGGK